MTLTEKEKNRHKNILYRLLTNILDDEYLANNLYFKGGTCAYMLGFLDRFSVDLDFDRSSDIEIEKAKRRLRKVFDDSGLKIDDQSKRTLQFFLKYEAPDGERNSIKLEAVKEGYKSNDYDSFHFPAIERTAVCQTMETMFANKLVAPIDRFENRGVVVGRDIYDIHHFFGRGFDYKSQVIRERREKEPAAYFEDLIDFIKKEVTQKHIEQDLNVLLDEKKFKEVRKHLKKETVRYLREEIN